MGCWGCPWGLTRQIACRPWQRVVASVQGSFLLRSRRWSHAHMGCPLECPYGTLAMKHVWVRAPGSTAFGICRTRGRICSLHFLSFTWREAVSWCYLRKVCSGDRFCSCLSFWCSLLSHMEGLLVFLVLYLFFSFSCRIELTLLPHTVCETYRCVQAFHLEGMPGSHSSRETGRSLCRTKAGISCHWIGVELSPFWAASASPETSLDDAPSLTASFPSKGAGEPRVSQGVCGEGRAECSTVPVSSACHCPETVSLLHSDICSAHVSLALPDWLGKSQPFGGCIYLAQCHFCVVGLFWGQFVTAGGTGKQCLLTMNQCLMKISNMHKGRKCFLHHLSIT